MNQKLSRHAWWLAWAVLLAVAVWLRLWQIGQQILIDDEWHAVHKLMFSGYRDIFLSFGHADHSIPLTLLFKTLADTIGLTEGRLRALPVAAGLATVLALPWIMRPWLKPSERWLFAGLIAISPLLIHFSRYVRPYALTIPLSFIAVVALWRWWHEGGRGWASLFVVATVLCAWLHPLTLLFTGSALLWFGLMALNNWRHGRGTAALTRIVPLGLLTAALSAVLVLPPLLADPHAMSSKSGIDSIQLITFLRSWELILGTVRWPVLLVLTVFAALGAKALMWRDRAFAGYWLFMVVISVLAIAMLDAAWIHHALVLVRYTATALPLWLALVALGAVAATNGLVRRWPALAIPVIGPGAGLLLLAAVYLGGPLPQTYLGTNPFSNHLRYQFDYDFERNPFSMRMAEASLPPVYLRMAAEPGDWVIIETPWHFESHFSPLSEYQRIHQMPVRIGMISGLCTPWTHGELHPEQGAGIRLRRFVFVNDLLAWRPPENRFVVFHLGSPFIDARALPEIGPCIEAFRERFGEPWHADEQQVVFQLPGRGA